MNRSAQELGAVLILSGLQVRPTTWKNIDDPNHLLSLIGQIGRHVEDVAWMPDLLTVWLPADPRSSPVFAQPDLMAQLKRPLPAGRLAWSPQLGCGLALTTRSHTLPSLSGTPHASCYKAAPTQTQFGAPNSRSRGLYRRQASRITAAELVAAMKRSLGSVLRRFSHQAARAALSLLPRPLRFAVYRELVDCDPHPDARLQLKIADTQEELEACFQILHDAYVAAGFMKPDPSGLRVTIYHALPTTTTLCAKWDGRVVGTISMIREGVFGFPLQSVFDLGKLRSQTGRVAEISALAVAPAFRSTGGRILFPLMKFMYEYCQAYFDTRHIVIAVNPNKIEMYESLLFFERLQARVVDNYDFANGAPAVGATLDLKHAAAAFEQAYGRKRERKNLSHYFTRCKLANIVPPQRPFFTTNDPVLTPAMMDYFFNQRTRVFDGLDDRRRLLLRSIYDHETYAAVLPQASAGAGAKLALRRHQRFSIRCPARLMVPSYGTRLNYALQVIEMSLQGFQAECASPLPEGTLGQVEVDLGAHATASVRATAVRRRDAGGTWVYGFVVSEPDAAWRRCVQALQSGHTHADLSAAPALVLPPLPELAQA